MPTARKITVEDEILETDGGNTAKVDTQTLGSDDGKLPHETGKDEEDMATVMTQTLGTDDDGKLLHETGKDVKKGMHTSSDTDTRQ